MIKSYMHISFVVLVMVSACQDYYFDFTENLRVQTTSITTAVYNVEPTDVLFVVDNSGSMAEEQDELIRNIQAFIEEMSLSPNDYRIGIISTDIVNYNTSPVDNRDLCCMHHQCLTVADCPRPTRDICSSQGICLSECCEDRDCFPGEVCVGQQTGCQTDGSNVDTNLLGRCSVQTACQSGVMSYCDAGRLRSPTGLPFSRGDDNQAQWFMSRPTTDGEKQTLISNFADTILSLGVRGSTFEGGLEVMRLALDPTSPPRFSGHNDGFPRDNAELAVIFLSDEEDCSRSSRDDYTIMSQQDCYNEQRQYHTNPIEYVAFLKQLKGGDLKRVRAAAIIGGVVYTDEMPEEEPPLSFLAKGCFTQSSIGASSACGCWANGFTNINNDLLDQYCIVLADEPYNQAPYRTPEATVTGGQGGCSAMPGSRYLEFLERLAYEREQAGYRPDTLVDSICSDNYRDTLINIVNSIILNNCFDLDVTPLQGASDIEVIHNGQTLSRVDNDSSEPGWSYYTTSNQVCLEGGIKKKLNDIFVIRVVTENTID